MGTGLDGSKIIAGRQNQGIDTVHNSFVVGHRSVGFHIGNVYRIFKF